MTDLIERGISSNGRALASHVRGTGIDPRILQVNVFMLLFFFFFFYVADFINQLIPVV